jgi:hypothetical protein
MTKELTKLIPKLLTVMSSGVIELWAAIPAGLAIQCPPYFLVVIGSNQSTK